MFVTATNPARSPNVTVSLAFAASVLEKLKVPRHGMGSHVSSLFAGRPLRRARGIELELLGPAQLGRVRQQVRTNTAGVARGFGVVRRDWVVDMGSGQRLTLRRSLPWSTLSIKPGSVPGW